MDLELKILKEKVLEDEKKSGIGSLYDDDKTSHQHIQLLKTKYAAMKKQFDRENEKQSKENLKVIAEQKNLHAQIQIMKAQNSTLQTVYRDYDQDVKKRQFELEKDGKDKQRDRVELEADIRQLESQLHKQSEEHYKNGMFLQKDAAGEKELKRRHEKEHDITSHLIEKKKTEQEKLQQDLNSLEKQYLGMAELQASLKEATELREKIELTKVLIQVNEVKVRVLTDANEYLSNRREELQDEKAESD